MQPTSFKKSKAVAKERAAIERDIALNFVVVVLEVEEPEVIAYEGSLHNRKSWAP